VNPTPNHPIGTVVFERTVRVREFESAKAGVFIQFELPDPAQANGSYGEQVLAKIGDAFFQAKTVVFDELGLDFNVDAGGVVREAAGGVVREAINATLGQVTEVQAPRQQPKQITAPAPQPAPVAVDQSQPPYDPRTTDRQEKSANARWAKARLETHPDEFWDNRNDKRNPKAPDFKHKDSGIGVWLD
jgi:hypothetical protein